MTDQPEPVLAVRLIGPAELVTAQRTYLTAYYRKLFPVPVTVRSSTQTARRTGHLRVYLTITPKGST